MKRVVTSRGLASFIGAAASLLMASEMYRDLAWGMRYFRAPAWAKALAMVGLLWLSMQEAIKVHARLEELVGG